MNFVTAATLTAMVPVLKGILEYSSVLVYGDDALKLTQRGFGAKKLVALHPRKNINFLFSGNDITINKRDDNCSDGIGDDQGCESESDSEDAEPLILTDEEVCTCAAMIFE